MEDLAKLMGKSKLEVEEMLKKSDVITLHVPGTALTKNMIGKGQLKMMKKGAILIGQ